MSVKNQKLLMRNINEDLVGAKNNYNALYARKLRQEVGSRGLRSILGTQAMLKSMAFQDPPVSWPNQSNKLRGAVR